MATFKIEPRRPFRLPAAGLRVTDPVGKVRVWTGDIEYECYGRDGDELLMRPVKAKDQRGWSISSLR